MAIKFQDPPIPTSEPDSRLVALVVEGDDRAFDAIVDRYGESLRDYLRLLLSPGHADEVLQQALVDTHAGIRAGRQRFALRPWLLRIAHDAALESLRARAADPRDRRAGALLRELEGTGRREIAFELQARRGRWRRLLVRADR